MDLTRIDKGKIKTGILFFGYRILKKLSFNGTKEILKLQKSAAKGNVEMNNLF